MFLSIIRNEMDRQNTSVYHPKTGIAVLKKVRYAHGGLCPRRPMPSRTSSFARKAIDIQKVSA